MDILRMLMLRISKQKKSTRVSCSRTTSINNSQAGDVVEDSFAIAGDGDEELADFRAGNSRTSRVCFAMDAPNHRTSKDLEDAYAGAISRKQGAFRKQTTSV
jgi:hypothetical protein